MTRKKAFDREQAIEKVMLKIWQDGYHNASVKSLSEMLGITRSSFYHAFNSRESLFKEVLSAYSQYTPMQNLLRAQKGELVLPMLTQTLRTLCAVRGSDSSRKGCLAMNSIAELCGAKTELSCHLGEQLELSNALTYQLLSWAKEQNEIPQDANIESLALAVTNLFVGLNIMGKAIPDEHKLWLAASTTLKGLGLLVDTTH